MFRSRVLLLLYGRCDMSVRFSGKVVASRALVTLRARLVRHTLRGALVFFGNISGRACNVLLVGETSHVCLHIPVGMYFPAPIYLTAVEYSPPLRA